MLAAAARASHDLANTVGGDWMKLFDNSLSPGSTRRNRAAFGNRNATSFNNSTLWKGSLIEATTAWKSLAAINSRVRDVVAANTICQPFWKGSSDRSISA